MKSANKLLRVLSMTLSQTAHLFILGRKIKRDEVIKGSTQVCEPNQVT